MFDIDVEVARACLVIGLVMTAFFYSRTGIASGGAITGSYLALIVMTGQWLDIAGWFVLSLVGMYTIRLFANRWPLSRKWLFYLGVIVPATLHTVLIYVADVPEFSDLSAYMTAGLYVTNGLTAYDMQRQGVWKTLVSVAIVTTATVAVLIPINTGMIEFSNSRYEFAYFTPTEPLLILVCVLAAAAVNIGLGWGTAGIIGALFLVNILNWKTILLLVFITAIGAVIVKFVSDKMALTPRQRLYSVLVVSSIVSWFGLYWLEFFGVEAASQLSQYGVETLLVIGLLVNELVKLGPARAYGGAAIVLLVTAVVSWALGQQTVVLIVVLAAVVAWLALTFTRGVFEQRALWQRAIAAGK